MAVYKIPQTGSNLQRLASRHPVALYFVMTFSISWTLAFLVVAPQLLASKPIPYFDGVLMFPAMLVGPSVSGILLTRIIYGKTGLSDLFSRMRKIRVGKWYLPAIFIPPTLILSTLFVLSRFVSPVYTPNIFLFGIGFGILAGYLEEIGWTGFAILNLEKRYSAFSSALILGALWGMWHAPVVDFLGAAYPHGVYWLEFFLAFIAVMMAMRVLIVWICSNTNSIFLAQVMHASSTGFLALLAPAAVLPLQEAFWYACYAGLLWIVVLVVVKTYGPSLTRERLRSVKKIVAQ